MLTATGGSLLLQALSKAERDLQLARKDVQMLRQERSAAGPAQERLLAAQKELERLQGTEAQLEKAEKVLRSLLKEESAEGLPPRPALLTNSSAAPICFRDNICEWSLTILGVVCKRCE